MKILVTITLAALAAASGVTAQDTLLIRSFRTIDVCSSERRWLIAPYLGNIRSIDSLASFDITIGFDTSLVRPTDVLTENTLSFGANYPAQMSLVVPGEMRIAGFNITRNMVGDKPIFAVAGSYTGDCVDSIRFTFPWPPTFNEEFKKKVTVLTSEEVGIVALAKVDKLLGPRFSADTVAIDGKDSLRSITTTVSFGTSNVSRGVLTWSLPDSTTAAIDTVMADGVTVDSLILSTMTATAYVSFLKGQTPTMSVRLRNMTFEAETRTVLYTSMEIADSCACVRSGTSDTLLVVLTNPIVSISSPVDDNNERLDVTNTSVTCHCHHGQTNEINVFTVAGERVATQLSSSTTMNTMSIENLPPGPYIIVGFCGKRSFVKLKLK